MARSLFAAAPSSLRRFESHFAAVTRARGIDYAARGLVRITQTVHDAVAAQVEGQERYDVALRAAGRVLRARCTCPHFVKGEACKHLWATLMVADRARALPRGDELRALELDAFLDAEDEEEFAEEENEGPEDYEAAQERGDRDAIEREAGTGRPQRIGPHAWMTAAGLSGAAPRLERVSWRDILAASGRTPRRPSPAPSNIRYVIDPPATTGDDSLVVRVVERAGRREAALWRPARLGRPLTSFVPEPDVALLGMLDALSQVPGGYSFGYGTRTSGTFSVSRVSGELLERLVATGRVCLGDADRDPLRWDPAPYSLALVVTRCGEGEDLRVRAYLERGDERIAASDPEIVLAGGFALWADRIAPIDDRDQFAWIVAERAAQPMTLSPGDIDDLVEALLCAPRAPCLHLPGEDALPEVRVPGRPFVLLRSSREAAIEGGQLVEAGFDYEGTRVSLVAPAPAALDRVGRRLVMRDASAEAAARVQLEAAGVRPLPEWRRPKSGLAGHRVTLGKLEPAARALVAQGWRVEVDGRLRRAAGALAVSVSAGIDWLDVRMRARFDGAEAAFPELLAALRQKRRSVVLADGSIGELSEEQLDRLRRWVAMGRPADGGLRFHKVQAALVTALVETEPQPSFDAPFAALRRDVHAFAEVTPLDARRTFRGRLREYQRYALGWFAALRRLGFGGCLADDMGLGKTVQVLAMLDARRHERSTPGPSLVVAPRSVLFNWAEEAARFVPRVRVLVHDGADRADPGDHFRDYDLVLTTYGLVRSDLDRLSQIDFDYLILDEAQAIKTARTATAQSVRALRARHRLAMTGTPVENHLGELAALLDFLNPGLLGASSALSALAQGTNRVDDATLAVLARAVRPFFLRRTKLQVAPELPERVEQTIVCELEGEQRRAYDELHAHYRRSLRKRVARDGVARSTAHILEALLRLRQAACHPGLIKEALRGEPSAKLDVLLQHLDAVRAQGQKALVFSQFTSLLAILRDRLDERGVAYESLDGKTTDRASPVRRFQTDPACSVFLLSLRAGGTGLNLTAAEYVFLLDPWWNPAVEAQAIDRAHRIGQTRTVLAYRLIARATVEEKVAALQAQKRELADALFGEGGAAVGGLTREDLENLLA